MANLHCLSRDEPIAKLGFQRRKNKEAHAQSSRVPGLRELFCKHIEISGALARGGDRV
jgi:hypothetical protein